MIRTIRSTFLLALIAAIAACGAPERTEGPAMEPQNEEPVTVQDQEREREMEREQMADTLDRDIQTFQTNVEEAIRQSEQEIERASATLQAESPEAWQELSNRATSTFEEIRAEVQGLIAEDNGRELERSREEAAEQLAELHGEVVQRQLESSRDARQFRQAAMQHLRSLENELDQLERDHERHEPGAIQERQREQEMQRERERDPAMHENGDDLRERLQELRHEVEELDMIEEEEFRDRHHQLAQQIGELTKEVKQHRYEKEWTEEARPY